MIFPKLEIGLMIRKEVKMSEDNICIDLEDTLELPEIKLPNLTSYIIGLLNKDNTGVVGFLTGFFLDEDEDWQYSCAYRNSIGLVDEKYKFAGLKNLKKWIKDNVPKNSIEHFLKEHCLVKIIVTEDDHVFNNRIPTLDVSFHKKFME